MCGIFGYVGKKHAMHRLLIHGLERLEYRGYDSAGIAVFGDNTTQILKTIGRVEELSALVRKEQGGSGKSNATKHYHSGIAHTRWATHGGVSRDNCHPHVSNDRRFYLVHNGIIENYRKLKNVLEAEGYTFYSDTDSEVIAVMIEKYRDGDLVSTLQTVTKQIRGAYALLVVDNENPEQMVGVRLGSPLLFGYDQDKENFFFASDAQAVSGYADKIVYLEDGDIVVFDGNDYTIVSGGTPVRRAIEDLDQEQLAVSKGKWKHFMLKEIFEQPAIVARIFKGRVDFSTYTLTADAFHGMQNLTINRVVFIACGTSYHSGLLGSLWMRRLAETEADAMIASEAENIPLTVKSGRVYVFPSQSGETADSIEILKYIKNQGGDTLGVVNVPGSTIARLTDNGLFMRAGTEIGVASTKAFLAQAVCIMLGTLFLAKRKGIRRSKYKALLHGLESLPMHIDAVLSQSEMIRAIAAQMKDITRFFFLGRGYQVPIAYESALKLKEISYCMAQGYPAGELKHGSLALIDEYTHSIMFIPSDEQFHKNISSLHEIQAREGKVFVVSDIPVVEADWNIVIPRTESALAPLLTAVVGQLFAYHFADLHGKDIDKPRNLAKSVTVK